MDLVEGRLYKFRSHGHIFLVKMLGEGLGLGWCTSLVIAVLPPRTATHHIRWMSKMRWSLERLVGLEEIQPADLLLYVDAPQKTPLYDKLVKGAARMTRKPCKTMISKDLKLVGGTCGKGAP